MSPSKPLAIVAGAGPGLGRALLARLDAGGMMTVGLGRTPPESPMETFRQVDLANEKEAKAVLANLIATHGPPRIVIHNTAELLIAPFTETSVADFQRIWATMIQSLVVLGQATLPSMVRAGGGTLLVSGATASLRGSARFSAFASAKFALRGLTQALAREYQPAGIHVAHIVLDGIIDTPRSRDLHSLDPTQMMKRRDIAEILWQLANQPRSTWTHEIDLRPSSEAF